MGEKKTADNGQHEAAEDTLRQSEARFREVLENSRDAIYKFDLTTNTWDYISPACEAVRGFTPGELADLGLEEVQRRFHPDDYPRMLEHFERLAAAKPDEPIESTVEYRWKHKDGKYRWCSDAWKFIRDEAGKPTVLFGAIRDITKRKQAEEELRRSERRYRILFDNVPAGVYRTTPDGRILMANPALVEMLGYASFEELAKRNLEAEGFEPDYPRSRFKELIERDGRIRDLESTWSRRDGVPVRVSENAIAVRNQEGTTMYYEGIVQDITERKRAEEALRASEERYRAIFEQAGDSIVLVDLENGALVEFNDKAHENLGYTRQEFQQITVPDIEAIESAGDFARRSDKVARQGSDQFETKHRTKGGEIRDVLVSIRAIKLHGRHLALNIWRDITDRKRAEEALQDSEELYRALFEQAADSIVLIDAETVKLAEFNKSTHENLGYTRQEFQRLKMPDIEAMESAEDIRAHLRKIVKQGGDQFETRHRTKDGRIRDVLVSTRPIRLQGRDFALSIWRDITEHKQAEEALRDSEELYRALFEQAADSIVLLDTQSAELVEFNDRAYENLGYTRQELQRLTMPEIEAIESAEDIRAHLRKIVKQGDEQFETRHRTKDGRIRDILVNTKPIRLQGRDFALSIWRDITEHKQADQALRAAHMKLMTAREQERRHLASELHDSIGQSLVAMQLSIQKAVATAGKTLDDEQKSLCAAVAGKCRELVREVRQICHGLYPPVLESLGLAPALEQLLDYYRSAGTQAGVYCRPRMREARFSPDTEIALFRVAQEAVNNAIRHGKAEHIDVELEEDKGRVVLSITDDGKGFDVEAAANNGLGLNTMRDRMQAVGGELDITSRKGETQVRVSVPAEPEGSEESDRRT